LKKLEKLLKYFFGKKFEKASKNLKDEKLFRKTENTSKTEKFWKLAKLLKKFY
jgi:hypothetical protein